MAVVRVMQVAIVEIIDVVVMLDCGVAAAGAGTAVMIVVVGPYATAHDEPRQYSLFQQLGLRCSICMSRFVTAKRWR